MMLFEISYHIIIILGESVFLGGFKLEDDVFDIFSVDDKK